MKTLWRLLSFFAIVNLLALVAFVGWLIRTDRLDRERVYGIRDMLAPTITEVQQAEDHEQTVREAEMTEEQTQWRDENPFPPSVRQVRHLERMEDRATELTRRAEADMEQLREQLRRDQEALAAERAAFEAKRDAFNAVQGDALTKAEQAQFDRVVGLLESIRPAQARDLLKQWVAEDDLDQAVRYLNAMKQRIAAKVLKEFKNPQEQVMAKELLERLQTLGQGTGAAQSASDDSTPGDTS